MRACVCVCAYVCVCACHCLWGKGCTRMQVKCVLLSCAVYVLTCCLQMGVCILAVVLPVAMFLLLPSGAFAGK